MKLIRRNISSKNNKNGEALKGSYAVVVALTLTRIIKSVVTGQAPITLKLRNTQGKKHKPIVVYAYITDDAIHASARNK